MKDECVYGAWRVRYIDEHICRLYVRYFNTPDGVQRFFDRIRGSADYTLLDCHRWDSYEVRWKKLDDFDSLEKGF